jgi:hypothetical protein
MITSSSRGVGGTRRRPAIRNGIVPPAAILISAVATPAPHDHFTAGPDCCMRDAGIWSVDTARCGPAIRSGIIPAAGVRYKRGIVGSAPHDHLAAGPDRNVGIPASRRIGRTRWGPAIRAGVVPPAGVFVHIIAPCPWPCPAPNNHFAASPDCSVPAPRCRRVCGACGCPTIGGGMVPASRGRRVCGFTPDDHLTAGPDCTMPEPTTRRVCGTGGCPTICSWIVPPASV